MTDLVASKSSTGRQHLSNASTQRVAEVEGPDNGNIPLAVRHGLEGLRLAGQGRHAVALRHFDTALGLCPTYAEVWFYRGLTLKQAGQLRKAYDSIAQAIILTPGYVAAKEALSDIASTIGCPAEILTPWPARPSPAFGMVTLNKIRAALQIQSMHYATAISDDNTELGLRSRLVKSATSVNLVNRLGRALRDQGRYSEAEAFFRYALALQPWNGQAAIHLCGIFEQTGRLAQIKEIVLAAYASGARDDKLLEFALQVSMHFADWAHFEFFAKWLRGVAKRNRRSVTPFVVMHHFDEPYLQKHCATIFTNSLTAEIAPLNISFQRTNKRHLTIGYVSADFRAHAVASLIAELFEVHDRTRYRINGYSLWNDKDTDIGQRIRAAFDKFVDLHGVEPASAARFIAEDDVDILVDLTGHTQHAEPRIFAFRPAPVQINYLGYPGTLGSAHIDYMIVDSTTAPAANEKAFTEALVYMPDSYQVNDRKRYIDYANASRSAYGLDDDTIVYCNLGSLKKLTPNVFSTWINILRRVPKSALWLYVQSNSAIANLQREARDQGISPDRLHFAPRVTNEKHLARYSSADLFLDTHPYNAHTTASDALWGGCPVLTFMGSAFHGRVAASLLKAVGMPELIVTSWAEYEDLAVRIGQDVEFRMQIKEKLKSNRDTCALFDTPRYARHLEWAYEQMWHNHVEGKKPISFEVPVAG